MCNKGCGNSPLPEPCHFDTLLLTFSSFSASAFKIVFELFIFSQICGKVSFRELHPSDDVIERKLEKGR